MGAKYDKYHILFFKCLFRANSFEKKVEITILSFLNVNMEFQCIQIHKEIANCRSVGVLDNIKVLSAWKLQRPSSTMNILR